MIKYIVTVIGMVASIVCYSFTTFATKEEIKESVLSRLDRIESKLDRLIERKN